MTNLGVGFSNIVLSYGEICMNIEILDETTEFPLQLIGKTAGVCWGSDTQDKEKNIKRAKDCVASQHGRVLEWPEVHIVISGVSARCMREMGRHVIGVSYLQESTRYVDCAKFAYYNPPMNPEQKKVFDDTMNHIKEGYEKLLEIGVSKEDAANVLPLGMHTKVVWKGNVRMLENFMNQRLCSRAYKEIRTLANKLAKELSSKNEEWKWIVDNLFIPKCKKLGYCPEKNGCGISKKKV